MKILLLDIETAPHRVYTWGLFKQTVAINQIEEPGYTLCWAAKWFDEVGVHYSSIHKHGKREMLDWIWSLLDEADVVVHFNGTKFDIPKLNQEFLAMGWKPPSPVIQIDLYRTIKARFSFASNKLSYVAEQLELGQKVNHKGMELWRECMAGDKEAWKTMEAYNIQDVVLLENLYKRLKPWIANHPNHNLFTEDAKHVCPNCGSDHVQKRGLYYAKTLTYQRYHCQDCGAWSRGKTNNMAKDKRVTVLVGVQ